ncbi:uncharacterized protein RSE6_16134 [Rhynchosporium secalis]|uniref:Uncharacterized protein n=1 Tax=Rhynchosporium secalis TaxID=38038 RepID=A0A1E1MTN9_RHYSE|nr:uncharacterized protein RSE6_16134 [Rhynchosporium secalis]
MAGPMDWSVGGRATRDGSARMGAKFHLSAPITKRFCQILALIYSHARAQLI